MAVTVLNTIQILFRCKNTYFSKLKTFADIFNHYPVLNLIFLTTKQLSQSNNLIRLNPNN